MEIDRKMTPVEDAAIRRRRYLLVPLSVVLLLALPVLILVTHPVSASSVSFAAPIVQAPASTVAVLEASMQKNPSIETRINLAVAYIDRGEAQRAMPLLLSVVSEDGNNALAWNDLCVVHTMQKSYAPALSACNKALVLSPDFQLAQNNLRWALHEQSATDAALKAKESVPEPVRDVPFYVNRGTDQLHLGRYKEAIQSWEMALRIDPKNAAAVNDIGVAYMMMKRADEAVVWFDRALALDPQFQLAKNNLAWARSEQVRPTTK